MGEVVAAPLIVGAVLSIVKTWPVKFPLPMPVPPSLFPAASTIVSLSTRLSPSVPSPVPVLVVTVYEAPVPVTLVKDAPVMPVGASAKSAVSTPVTLSLKVTVHCTLAALVGVLPTRLIELTVGAVLSIVKTGPVKFPLPVPVPPSLFPAASTIVSLSTRLSPSVPLPVPVPAVTV